MITTYATHTFSKLIMELFSKQTRKTTSMKKVLKVRFQEPFKNHRCKKEISREFHIFPNVRTFFSRESVFPFLTFDSLLNYHAWFCCHSTASPPPSVAVYARKLVDEVCSTRTVANAIAQLNLASLLGMQVCLKERLNPTDFSRQQSCHLSNTHTQPTLTTATSYRRHLWPPLCTAWSSLHRSRIMIINNWPLRGWRQQKQYSRLPQNSYKLFPKVCWRGWTGN